MPLTLTCKFFTKGIDRRSLHAAYIAVCEHIEYIRASYTQHGWDMVYGTSGTMRAIAELTSQADGGAIITEQSLNALIADIETDGGIARGDFSKQRREVLPAGIIILKAIFDELGIKTLHVADATLKEGLIYDTLGRLGDNDTRHSSVKKLQTQYRIDTHHAERVSHLALHLWRQIDGPTLPGASRSKLLNWAAQLHEIGLGISHTGHHHHGLYILQHSDLAGFGRYEQLVLAHMVGCHRKKIAGRLDALNGRTIAAITPLLLCLRLSVILHRGRDGIDTQVNLSFADNSIQLEFDSGWLEDQPLTQAGLSQEVAYLAAVGIALHYSQP